MGYRPIGTTGQATYRKFPFAFDTPGLLTGHAVYTPTVGDILLDAWFEVDTAWDGTSPKGDYGKLLDGPNNGWLQWEGNGPYDMANADTAPVVGALADVSLASRPAPGDLWMAWSVSGSAGTYTLGGARLVPFKFTAANPILACVSQDGTNTGADPGSTQGAAILYLVTATPV